MGEQAQKVESRRGLEGQHWPLAGTWAEAGAQLCLPLTPALGQETEQLKEGASCLKSRNLRKQIDSRERHEAEEESRRKQDWVKSVNRALRHCALLVGMKKADKGGILWRDRVAS